MIDFTALEQAQIVFDAADRLAKMCADKVARELVAAVKSGGPVAVRYSRRDGHITERQARELLREMLDGLSPQVRAQAEAALAVAR